ERRERVHGRRRRRRGTRGLARAHPRRDRPRAVAGRRPGDGGGKLVRRADPALARAPPGLRPAAVSRAATVLRMARRAARDPVRWARIAAGGPAKGVRVFYGRDRMPGRDEPAHGGLVKLARLAETFPNDARGFSVLYLGSSSRPHDLRVLIRLARRRGAAVAWHQAGVGYPGWA